MFQRPVSSSPSGRRTTLRSGRSVRWCQPVVSACALRSHRPRCVGPTRATTPAAAWPQAPAGRRRCLLQAARSWGPAGERLVAVGVVAVVPGWPTSYPLRDTAARPCRASPSPLSGSPTPRLPWHPLCSPPTAVRRCFARLPAPSPMAAHDVPWPFRKPRRRAVPGRSRSPWRPPDGRPSGGAHPPTRPREPATVPGYAAQVGRKRGKQADRGPRAGEGGHRYRLAGDAPRLGTAFASDWEAVPDGSCLACRVRWSLRLVFCTS
jgi:hypothetical protein